MKLESIEIKNFKGFKDSGRVEFGPGFNIIVGQNNSGKTALIEALKIHNATNDPHRERGKQAFQMNPISEFLVSQSISRRDIVAAAVSQGQIWINNEKGTQGSALEFLNNYNKGSFTFKVNKSSGEYELLESPSAIFHFSGGMHTRFQYDRSSELFASSNVVNLSNNQDSDFVRAIEGDSIFVLNSQRYNIGQCGANLPNQLAQDASNLPSALNYLQGARKPLFQKIVDNLKEIFPSVGDITISPILGSTNIQILVWPFDDGDTDVEATPLDKSGTGLSQALAILFVAVQQDEKVIIIDEISSFLHPMAIKNLIRLLKSHYSHHQYIISSHYTDVISWSEPDKVILTQKRNNACTARNISVADVDEFQFIAGELGISMSDVFGSDQIIWVEGETEESCFPYLLSHLNKPLPRGTNFSKVVSTGNVSLRGRTAKVAFDIYEKISRMASPLTRTCIFTLDRETMSDADIEKLNERAHGNLLVLDRRCYENYLLSPSAIAALLNQFEAGDWAEQVQAWLIENGGKQEYGAPTEWTQDLTSEAWLKKVDGATLLEDLVPRLTGERHRYQKTTHSLELTKLMATATDPSLTGLLEFVSEIHRRVTS